jgi:hypothetical protein
MYIYVYNIENIAENKNKGKNMTNNESSEDIKNYESCKIIFEELPISLQVKFTKIAQKTLLEKKYLICPLDFIYDLRDAKNIPLCTRAINVLKNYTIKHPAKITLIELMSLPGAGKKTVKEIIISYSLKGIKII